MLVKPKLGDDVLQTDIDQTEAVNATDVKVVEHDSKIMQLLNWMGLVKDYVIETGNNANGSWEKWASGKLVQKSKITITTGTTESFGSLYRSNSTTTIKFPIPFIDTPELSPNNNGPGAFKNIVQSLDKDSFGLRLIHVFNQKIDTPISYIAVGKWK